MTEVQIYAYPMHGVHKMLVEGFRTRDAHLIEWFARLNTGSLTVVSRPEPVYLKPLVARNIRRAGASLPDNVDDLSKQSWRLPNPRDRRSWWVATRNQYDAPVNTAAPTIVWNPIIGVSNIIDLLSSGDRRVHVDLLDDWLSHKAFGSIRGEVEAGYRGLFRVATSVTANGEGTLALARSFGRDDCILLPNGVDPERFSTESKATGPLTVGYVGKIGFRLDLDGILNTVRSIPQASFVFAGPILDSEYRAPLMSEPNVTLLGDIQYKNVPALLQKFDLGWVPHGVGQGSEVGGDVIKIYEYRAAGLPTITTPVSGAGNRGLSGVTVAPIVEHAGLIRQYAQGKSRPDRTPAPIPTDATWRSKAALLLSYLGLQTDQSHTRVADA